MKPARLFPCLLLLSLACACASNPSTDDGSVVTAGDAKQPADEGKADEGGAQVCSSDADCVPAQCCHPTSCVVASAAPNCADMSCTEECRGGTMDCGQGHCACQEGSCVAVIDEPIAPE